MRLLVYSMILLMFAIPAYGANPYKCKKTEECISVYHGCGRYASVNKKYKVRVEMMTRKKDTKDFCRPPSKAETDFFRRAVSSCVKKECLLIEPVAKKAK